MATHGNVAEIMRSGLRQHASALRHALNDLIAHPLAHLLAVFTIATALALPTGLFTLLSGLQEVTQSWDQGREINLYMVPKTSNRDLAKVSKQLRARSDVAEVRLISSQTAVRNLETATGLSGIQDLLGEAALPPVLVVTPSDAPRTPAELEKLGETLAQLPHVEEVQFDKEWAEQTAQTLDVLQRFGILVAVLFGITVVLVVAGTLRMAVMERREEIEVTKLVGGSDAFIQRPFIYTAVFLGLASSLLAIVLVSVGLATIAEPLSQLIGIFSGQIQLGISAGDAAMLIFLSCVLSIASAWATVHLQIRNIEPH